MTAFDNHLNRMRQLLDRLIDLAKELRDISTHAIAEEELSPLQQQQEDILKQLAKLDAVLNTKYASKLTPEIHAELHAKLQEFQDLNKEYIHNLNTTHGLIQFELKRFQFEEKEDLPPPSFFSK
jgi:hypothetical protein